MIRNRFDDRPEIEYYLPTQQPAPMPALSVPLVARIGRWIAEHPKQSLITALTAGAVLGWITKRR